LQLEVNFVNVFVAAGARYEFGPVEGAHRRAQTTDDLFKHRQRVAAGSAGLA
jgi:hypothetical protein